MKGYIIMLPHTLERNGHVNGSRYIVEILSKNVLFLRCINKQNYENSLTLTIIPCGLGDGNCPVPLFTITKSRIIVCFGVTNNKAQETSLTGRLGLNICDEYLNHGQVYVAQPSTINTSNVMICNYRDEGMSKKYVYTPVLSLI